MKRVILGSLIVIMSVACGEKIKAKRTNDGFFVKPQEAVQLGSFYIEPQETSKSASIVETLVTFENGKVTFSQVQGSEKPVRTETVYEYEISGAYMKLKNLVSKSNCEVSKFSSEVGSMIAAKKLKNSKYRFVVLRGTQYDNGIMRLASNEEKTRIKSVKECGTEAQ